jgi:hypothetical protein
MYFVSISPFERWVKEIEAALVDQSPFKKPKNSPSQIPRILSNTLKVNFRILRIHNTHPVVLP